MAFIGQYYFLLVIALIPFALGILIIAISPIIKERNEKYSLHSTKIGILI